MTESIATAPNSSAVRIQRVIWIISALILAYGIYRVVSLSWVGDDAFISFRYAKNLIDGHGLVFNVGERVEGYTNFLWTMLLAGGMRLGLDPVPLSMILGGLSFLGTVGLFGFLSLRIGREIPGAAGVIIPLTPLALLLHRDMQVYATSGLETALFTALVSVGFVLLVRAREPRRYLYAGLALVAAVMTRPDAMIFYVAAVPFLLAERSHRLARLGWFLTPLVVIYLPYWLWRYSYYRYVFPNTYYAKSAGMPFYGQGLEYVWLYFKTYYILWLAPLGLAALAACLVGMHRLDKIMSGLHGRLSLLALLFVVPYLAYVIRVGGDFMFARFLIPITPLLYLSIEMSLPALARSARSAVIISTVVLVATTVRWNQFVPEKKVMEGITDEHAFYPMARIDRAREVGVRLKEDFKGVDCTVGFYGMYAMYMYYGDFPTAVECNTGLTDEHLAHLPIPRRTRIGHEKMAPPEYMVERKIRFLFQENLPNTNEYDRLRVIAFGDFRAYILTYENEVMDRLAAHPGVKFTNMPEFLDDYLANISRIPLERRRRDFGFLREYYFQNNDDTARYDRFLEAVKD